MYARIIKGTNKKTNAGKDFTVENTYSFILFDGFSDRASFIVATTSFAICWRSANAKIFSILSRSAEMFHSFPLQGFSCMPKILANSALIWI